MYTARAVTLVTLNTLIVRVNYVLLRRRELKVLVGLLTGHTTLNRHLCVMKLRKDPLCSACGEEKETAFHFLGRCSARIPFLEFHFWIISTRT